MKIRKRTYSPQLPPGVIKALYFESKNQNKPMTKLATEILTKNLQRTPGWHKAREEMKIE